MPSIVNEGQKSSPFEKETRTERTALAILVKLIKAHCFSLKVLINSISPNSPKSFRSFASVYTSKSSILPEEDHIIEKVKSVNPEGWCDG